MRIACANVLVMCSFMVSVATLSRAQYPDTVKIMTYNINYESNKNTQYDGIIKVIKEIDPTIAGLQKLDSCMGTISNPCYVAKLIGDQTNMSYEFVTADPQSYGNGFLSKQPPKSVRKIKLTGSATMPRAALEIGVTVGGEPVRVIVTHLDLSAANRTSEMKQIIAWMDSGGAKTIPAVIMADFNAGPTEDCMTQLTNVGFVFLKTSTGVILDTAQKINHILYRPENRWSIVGVGNPAYAASNRYPLWANMKLIPSNDVASPRTFVNNAARSGILIAGHRIELQLSEPSEVSLGIFALSGKKIALFADKGNLAAGKHAFLIPEGVAQHGMVVVAATINGSMVTKNVFVSR
jgi:endonuclease/exonuclease/phosphatase family metal-dependent hydrolase